MSILEHQINEEILEEAKMELIVMVMRRRLEWFGRMKIRDKTEKLKLY